MRDATTLPFVDVREKPRRRGHERRVDLLRVLVLHEEAHGRDRGSHGDGEHSAELEHDGARADARREVAMTAPQLVEVAVEADVERVALVEPKDAQDCGALAPATCRRGA